jgi:two-component system sensor histidine kinase AgrC
MTKIATSLGITSIIVYTAAVFFILLDVTVKHIWKSKRAVFFIFALIAVLAGNLLIYLERDISIYSELFPLTVHLPMFLLFWGFTKYRKFKLIFILLTAMVWTSPIMLISNTISAFFDFKPFYGAIAKLLLLVPLLFILNRYFKPYFKFMLDHCDTGWKLFSAVPLLAVIATYINGQYRFVYDIDSWNETAVWRYFISAMSFLSYILILNYFKQTREKMEAEGTLELLQTQLDGTLLYINTLKSSQQQADIYLHDLRHHFRLIFGYASAKDYKAITDYINRMEKSIEAVSPLHFCKNDALNLILSAFQSEAEKEGISLHISINMADQPPIPDIELCAIFSNGLENAIKATRDITGCPKEVFLSCHTRNEQLFLEIKNPYEGIIEFENGCPKASEHRRGIGTKSIALIVEEHGGLYRFETQNGMFILNVIL